MSTNLAIRIEKFDGKLERTDWVLGFWGFILLPLLLTNIKYTTSSSKRNQFIHSTPDCSQIDGINPLLLNIKHNNKIVFLSHMW
jgi:hypothetical protein